MRQFLSDLLAQMKGIWARLEAPQRLVVSAVFAATLVGLGAIIWFAGRPTYETVYTGPDIAKAQQALQSNGVSFVVGDGPSLQVERSDRNAAFAAIQQAGLVGAQTPTLGGGSMIEDSATKAWRLDNVARAQAEQAIMGLAGVTSARVTSSRPRRLVAYRSTREEQKATATVLLQLKPGTPWEQTAHAAASLAASQLMVPKRNIDVVNATTSQRWSYNPDIDSGAGSSQFRDWERRLSEERTLRAMDRLDRLYPGKISVDVTVELDPSWEVRSEKVLPTEPLMKKEDTTKDSTEPIASAEEASGTKSKNEKKTIDYVTEIGERRVGKMAPEIRRLSVAVLYDSSLEKDDPNFDPKNLEAVVKSIVGWDPQRDVPEGFSMMKGTFAPIEPIEMSGSGPGMGELIAQWGPTIGQILGVLVVVMFLRGLFKGQKRAPAVEEAPAPVELDEESLTPDEQQKRMRREIERSIASDPAALAKMLEAWLMEQKA